MALRVLLADESVTIKKVIQLALQDFAVEVKAVPVGLDVLEVSKSFQPDLVFADVLLQKRSGYDVCRDLKKDVQTAAIPVILMWSSFMELDQKQVEACGADGRLEKPFEVEALRKMVLDLVPRTRSQRLATFLEYPATIAAPLKTEVAEAAKNRPPPLSIPTTQKPTETSPPTGSFSNYTPAIPNRPQDAIQSPAPSRPISPQDMPPANFSLGAGIMDTSLSKNSSPMFPTNVTDTNARPTKPVGPPSDLGDKSSADEPQSTEWPPLAMPKTSDESYDSAPPKTEWTHFGKPKAAPEEAPLGALPDLKLDAQDSKWSMESFEPLDLSPLNLEDDDSEEEAFQPIKLPDAEPIAVKNRANPPPFTPFGLDDTDQDSEADKWANKSLEKYRLAPLFPEESLAEEDAAADLSKQTTNDYPVFQLDDQEEHTPTHIPVPSKSHAIPQSELENTEIVGQKAKTDRTTSKAAPFGIETLESESDSQSDEEIAEFTLSDADHRNLQNLEIERVDHSEITRPTIVRELLKDPDFSYDENSARQDLDETLGPRGDKAFDLATVGRPPQPDISSSEVPVGRIEDRVARREAHFGEKSGAFGRDRTAGEPPTGSAPRVASLEERMAAELEPQLERVVEKIVASLLPKIAEKIIKRELERLLEDS